MSGPDRNRVAESEIRYDNWPVEGGHEYDDWDVIQTTPREQDGTLEELGEEYGTELADDEVEWIGLPGGAATGSPLLYSRRDSTLYEGELDETDERVVLRQASRHEVDEESLGEHIEEIGEDHDWEWLSSFARKYLEDNEGERSAFEHRDSVFQQRNVGETDAYDLAFYGSHTFVDESRQAHTIDRFFNVYLDEDSSDVSRIEVDEEYLIAEKPASERPNDDAAVVDENEREIDVHLDAETRSGEGELERRLEEWHEDHLGWQSAE